MPDEMFPPEAIDCNALPDKEKFWDLTIPAARKLACVGSPSKFKTVSDVIFWLNMVACQWEDSYDEEQF